MAKQLPQNVSKTDKQILERHTSRRIPDYSGILLIVLLSIFSFQTKAQGTWTAVSTACPGPCGGGMLLLSDGSVLAKSFSGGADGYGNQYYKLTPDIHGSYINGTWSAIAAMHDTRLYYSTQLLKDGRVYIAGGEYGSGNAKGETYDPLTNVWTSAPAPGQSISDANSEILQNGKVLQALVTGNLRAVDIYDPVSNTYSAGNPTNGIHNESAWVKLKDNSILFVDRLSTSSERYIPSMNQWVTDATVPVSLYDSFGDETGAGILLPDGRVFFLGSTGHTAYYTPSGTSSPGSWVAGPNIPGSQGTPDAPAAMMVNGKILCSVAPVPSPSGVFQSPTAFYEFNYLTNSFTQVNAPGGGTTVNVPCYETNFLDLPDGSVMYGLQGSTQFYIYTPGGTQLTAGKPVIGNISQNTCSSFSIMGTLFNGISEGTAYGDDWQMASNYPIVRLTSGSNVYYARTFNWNLTGVQTGSLPDTAQFTLPAGLPAGTYSLSVIANGISSDPFSFNPIPALSSSLTPPAICSNTAFTYTPTSASGGATFTWTRAAVPGISNPAVVVPQTTNPNEVLINTTSNPVSVIYAYTITVNTCSNSQNVTVVVNPSAIPTITGTTTFCQHDSTVLTANSGTGILYQWTKGGNNIAGATNRTYTAKIGGRYKVLESNSFGCASASPTKILTVIPLPVATITPLGSLDICQTGSVVLQADSGTGFTYQWRKGVNNISGATNQTYTATAKGTYLVTVTNSSGCSKTSKGTKVTKSCLMVKTVEVSPAASLLIYPNPAVDLANIQILLTRASHVSITVYAVNGKAIKTLVNDNLGEGSHSLPLDTKEFSKGIYYVKIVTDNAIKNQKLIVQ